MDTIKKKGRPKFFNFGDIKDKKYRTLYMLNKEWFCDICKNDKNYTMAGKTLHCRTKKHLKKI